MDNVEIQEFETMELLRSICNGDEPKTRLSEIDPRNIVPKNLRVLVAGKGGGTFFAPIHICVYNNYNNNFEEYFEMNTEFVEKLVEHFFR